MKITYIPANDSQPTKVEYKTKLPSYNLLTKFLEGPLERFSLKVRNNEGKAVKATMYVNEMFQIRDLPVNKRATWICHEASRLMNTRLLQIIQGNVIVTQPDDRMMGTLYTQVKAAAPKGQPFVGSVVSTRLGKLIILTQKPGRKFIEYKWALLDDPSKTGWIKWPFSYGDPFSKYPFVRKATPKEINGGTTTLRKNIQEKYERISQNRNRMDEQEIKPGDIVEVDYRDYHGKKEAVLEVNYKTGKLAIVRDNGHAAEAYSKKRMIPMSLCKKIEDGGGSFKPNNPIYHKNGIYIPDFYKRGGVVAPRPSSPQF